MATIAKKTEKEPTPDPAPQPAKPADTAFNPLADSVNEKSYTGGGPTGGAQEQQFDIPEPTYTPPPQEANDIPTKENGKQQQKKEEAKEKPSYNPDMQNASDKEKHEGAAAMTDVLLGIWGQGYNAANKMMMFSEKRINKLHQAGQIDVRAEVAYKMGTATIGEVFKDFNKDMENLLVLEPEFVEKVHPLITEELAKAGHGMSKRGELIFYISMKLVGDGTKVAQVMSMKKEYLRFAREAMVSARRPAPAPTPQPVQEQETHIPENESAEQDSVIVMEPEETGTTLQEKAMASHYPGGVKTNSGLPQFGNKKKIRNLNKVHAEVTGTKKKGNKTKAKSHIDHARTTTAAIHDPVPSPVGSRKGKKGRPPGAKNKPKR